MSLQKHPGSRIWGFTPFPSRKDSKTVLYIHSPLALLTLVLSTEMQSLALWSHHACTSSGALTLLPLPKVLAFPQSWRAPKSNPLPRFSSCCVLPQHPKVSPPLRPCATTTVEYPRCFRARSCSLKCRWVSCYCLGKFYIAKKWASWGLEFQRYRWTLEPFLWLPPHGTDNF